VIPLAASSTIGQRSSKRYVTIDERHARYYTTPEGGNVEILNIYGMIIAKVG
jgi:hypothetical protein